MGLAGASDGMGAASPAIYLVAETLLASLVVLGVHALRRRASLVYSYAVVAFMAFGSWAAPHRLAIGVGPLSFYVESSVFFAAALLGVFVLYVADSPRAGRMGLCVVVGTALLYTLMALLLHAQFAEAGAVAPWVFPSASLRAGTASIVATLVDLTLLGVLWEALQWRPLRSHLTLRVFLTLAGVLVVDSLIYVPVAWAGVESLGPILAGNVTSRLALAVFYAPIVGAYLRYEIRHHGLDLSPRPVFSILSKEDLERELVSARHHLRIGAEALWESEERYRRMLEDIPTMVFRFSRDGQVTYANRALCRYYDSDAESVVGTPVLTPVDRRERDQAWAQVCALTSDEPVADLTLHVFLRSGERRLQRWIIRGVFSTSGSGVAFQAVGEDITERTRSEQALRRLRVAIDQLSECVAITDASGRLEFVNPAFARAAGDEAPALIGRSVQTLFEGSTDPAAIAPLLSGIGAGTGWSGKLHVPSTTGRHRDFRVTVAPIEAHQGGIDGYAAIGRDITRELLVETHLQQAQRMEALGLLAGGVAHDFNNLLTVIWNCTDLASSALAAGDRDAPAVVDQSLRDIRRSADSAAELTRQLMTLGRQDEVEPRPVDVSRVVEELERRLRTLVRGSVQLELDCAPNLPAVLIDPVQLERVLINLVANARDAVSGSGRIVVSTARAGTPSGHNAVGAPRNQVTLRVSDTGLGMDARVRQRVFEPFFTTKGSDRGTGLGLSAVYSIVQRAGGSVDVQSEPGRGSTFSVHLPGLADAQASSSQAS